MQGRDLDAVLVPWLGIGVVRFTLTPTPPCAGRARVED